MIISLYCTILSYRVAHKNGGRTLKARSPLPWRKMPVGYDELMKPVIENIPVLIVVLVLTIPVAIFALRLAERAMKKQTAKWSEH